MAVTMSTTSVDQEKFLAAKLLQRGHLKLFAASICDKVMQPKGTGTTFNFVRYTRMNVPLVTLTEGTAPSASSITLETVTGTLDQWGDFLEITDLAKLTTKHPLVQLATELLSDNAQRVIDREVQIVMMAGTNVVYGDGSVTTRATVTNAMTIDDAMLHKWRITMTNNEAPPREGPSNMKENAKGQPASGSLLGGGHYILVAPAEVTADIQSLGGSGVWINVVQYNNAKAVYNAEVGTYLGYRVVESNFMPRLTILGNTTVAVASGAAFGTDTPVVTAVDGGGTLTSATTYYYKVTRKKLTRGFEEDISIEHTTASAATGNNESFTFNFSSLTAGYVYNLYFGSSTGDANLELVAANIAVGTTTTVTAVPASTTTPPSNLKVDGSVSMLHPVFVVASQAMAWIGLQDLKTLVTGDAPDKSDPLGQKSTIGFKFMAKAAILDQNRLLRGEIPSAFS